MDRAVKIDYKLIIAIMLIAVLFQFYHPLLGETLGEKNVLAMVKGKLCYIPIALIGIYYGVIFSLSAAALFSVFSLLSFFVSWDSFRSFSDVATEIVSFMLLAALVPVLINRRIPEKPDKKSKSEAGNRSDYYHTMVRLAKKIANDLKPPLNSINSALEKLEESQTDAEKDSLKSIKKEVERLNGVAMDYLDFAAPKVTHTGHVDVPSIIEAIVEQIKPQAERLGVRLAYDGTKIDGFTRGDAERLGRAFLNLILNGLQAVEGGGQVEIKCRYDSSAEMLNIDISDSGAGIREDIKERIFDPFFSTRPKGSGLGLTITKIIVEEHHGTITASNILSGGARFTIRLPVDNMEIAEY
ncbi:MAG: hypothetical protein GF315_07595 [candidate division Zixibacteria bacterium]|nr:hypothetical protein [candidate division Zixibacteria bacterium]